MIIKCRNRYFQSMLYFCWGFPHGQSRYHREHRSRTVCTRIGVFDALIEKCLKHTQHSLGHEYVSPISIFFSLLSTVTKCTCFSLRAPSSFVTKKFIFVKTKYPIARRDYIELFPPFMRHVPLRVTAVETLEIALFRPCYVGGVCSIPYCFR